MLRMEKLTKRYRHRGQLVTALEDANVHLPGGISPPSSGRAAAARVRCF